MKPLRFFLLAAVAIYGLECHGYAQGRLTPGDAPFISVNAPVVALEHARVIDGTGAAPRENQTIVIDHGKIAAVGPAAGTPVPPGAQTMDLTGSTVMPGIVGMHEHLFYPSGGGIAMYNEQAFSFPRLYLASGVTTARTAGSLEPYTDLNVKKLIDAGRMPGPKLWITGPVPGRAQQHRGRRCTSSPARMTPCARWSIGSRKEPRRSRRT